MVSSLPIIHEYGCSVGSTNVGQKRLTSFGTAETYPVTLPMRPTLDKQPIPAANTIAGAHACKHSHRRGRLLWFGVLIVACIYASGAMASGFYLSQQSARSIGRGFAGEVASADDAATVAANPAGMTELGSAQMMAGVSILIPETSFRNRGSSATTPGTSSAATPYGGGNGGNPFAPAAVGNAYAALPVANGSVWLGIGVTSPFGLSLDYGSDWFGRYDSIESSLTTIDVAPAVAYRLSKGLSVGIGLNVQSMDVRLTSAVPDTLAPGGPSAATDGRSVLNGDDLSLGFNVGVLFKAWPTARIGIHYRSGIDHTLKGRARISGLGGPLATANSAANAKATLHLPDILSAGLAQRLGDDLMLLAEFQWFNWSRFNEVRVRLDDGSDTVVLPQDYSDSYAVSVGGEFRWADDFTLRGGFRFETTPTSDQFRTTGVPEATNYSLGLGCSYWPEPDLAVDIAVFHTRAEGANVALSRTFFAGTSAEGSVDVKGRAKTQSTTFAFGLRYRF
jgi:long-chain fatty acid transport protein